MRAIIARLLIFTHLVCGFPLFALDNPTVPNTFTSGNKIYASEFNANNDTLEAWAEYTNDSLDAKFIRTNYLESGDSTLSRINVDTIGSNPYMDSIQGHVYMDSITNNYIAVDYIRSNPDIDSISGNPFIDSAVIGYGSISGNALIGGTLTSTGALTASSTLGVTGATTLYSTLNTVGNSDITLDTTTFFLDASTNRVGIGTTTPATMLEVVKASGDAIIQLSAGHDSDNPRIQLQDAYSVGSVINMYDASNVKQIVFKSYSDSYILGGNFGIGTTTPSEVLEVNGNILADTLKGVVGQAYGEMYQTATTTATTYTTSYAKYTGFDTEGVTRGVTVEITGGADRIIVENAGVYRITLSANLAYEGTNYTYSFALYLNGAIMNRSFQRLFGEENLNINFSNIVALTANDTLELYVLTSGNHVRNMNSSTLNVEEIR